MTRLFSINMKLRFPRYTNVFRLQVNHINRLTVMNAEHLRKSFTEMNDRRKEIHNAGKNLEWDKRYFVHDWQACRD